MMIDHEFQPCGAGARTSPIACWAVRERGGNRYLCHMVIGPDNELCQRPAREHRIPTSYHSYGAAVDINPVENPYSTEVTR